MQQPKCTECTTGTLINNACVINSKINFWNGQSVGLINNCIGYWNNGCGACSNG